MDREASAHYLLEGILLDENKDPTNLPIGLLESITNYFSNDQNIGSGGFADVYKGQLQSSIVAVKKLKELSGTVEDFKVHEKKFMQEVDCLMKVKHKNIVRFLGYCFDTQGKVLKLKGKNIMAEERQRFLCFEFLPQGSLDKYISDASNGLEWRTRYHIIKGICEGLQYLHGNKIVHADLKPGNIFLDDNMVPKIGDFGLARNFLEEQTSAITQNVFGTLGYMAPESFRGVITFASDIYSLGIIITEMLTGQNKYDLSIENVRANWIARFKTSHGGTWLEHVTVCAEIGLDCTVLYPKKRPTIAQIIDRLDELEHKYGSFGTGIPFPATQHVLDVYPLDIWFPFESDKVINCPVTLTNKTDDLIYVWVVPIGLDARLNPGYPYVWEPVCATEDLESSIFRRLGPQSSGTIYMTLRKQDQPPLEATDKGMFDVVMVAPKSLEGLERLHRDYEIDAWRENKSKHPLRLAKKFGTVVHQATLRAAVKSDPTRCQEVTAHQFLPAELDGDFIYIDAADVHPTKAWLLVCAYNIYHCVWIWNYETQKRVAKIKVKYLLKEPPREFWHISSIKFIAGEQWFAAGDTNGFVHVYAYTSFRAETDKVKEFDTHVGDSISSLAVYPKHTLLLTASYTDKSIIKLWDWSQGWTCARVIETFGILTAGRWDARTLFATRFCSEVKVWDIHSPDAIATFEGLWCTFYADGHGYFLTTTDDDDLDTIKIWDLQTKKHIHTLWTGKTWSTNCSNCNPTCHPTLPILATMHISEESKVHRIVLWDVRTYRVMKTVELLMEGYVGEILFDGKEDITSLMVVTDKLISIIKINVAMLWTGHSN